MVVGFVLGFEQLAFFLRDRSPTNFCHSAMGLCGFIWQHCINFCARCVGSTEHVHLPDRPLLTPPAPHDHPLHHGHGLAQNPPLWFRCPERRTRTVSKRRTPPPGNVHFALPLHFVQCL